MFTENHRGRRAGVWGVGATMLFASGLLLSPPAWSQSPSGTQAPAHEGDHPGTTTADSPAVVVPPPIDPGIEAPIKTRTHDKMPVVAPPGSPGGDPNTIAK